MIYKMRLGEKRTLKDKSLLKSTKGSEENTRTYAFSKSHLRRVLKIYKHASFDDRYNSTRFVTANADGVEDDNEERPK
jgi:hypothetical protein